ncbi:MAG TPA: hypothetical protein VMX76_02010 [Nevskiaceae bacterium]|nr:hypothetical protein [Nevskiaceae bacterium]
MSPEIPRDYSLRKRLWDDLTRLGMPVWDYEGAHTSIERQRVVFQEMGDLIGKPSLEAIRYLWKRFSDFVDIAAVAGCFYYYDRERDKKEYIQKEAAVAFPLEVALDLKKLSWQWIDDQRNRLAKEWGLEPVSFGITNVIYSSIDWQLANSSPLPHGGLSECWFGDPRSLLENTKFIAFADIDKKMPDEQILQISKELGTPFLVADTARGHHLLFPLIFGERRKTNVCTRIGLVLGFGWEEHRYLWHVLERGVATIRVTPGLRREETPKISALVWDENIIVRE